jgi:polyhydroxyalkanoate synthesis repressor PhaR
VPAGQDGRVAVDPPDVLAETEERSSGTGMDTEKEPTTIKKYANRRLYNTGTSSYVTLDDLAEMVKRGEDFQVVDAKSGDDITRSVLTQIIVEQENKGPNLLPVTFLRQLIRFYGDSLQNLVPTYLDFSIDALTREQEKFRNQMTQAFGVGPFVGLDEHVRRNTEMFEQAMRMFLPFSAGRSNPSSRASSSASEASPSDLDSLKRQLDEMQEKVKRLTEKS